MDFTVVTLHESELHTIIDAAIPNKAQNTAVKGLITTSLNNLMNRLANGWLEGKLGVGPYSPTPAAADVMGASSESQPDGN